MTDERKPNSRQAELNSLPIGNVLVIAPAGCGKTDALAFRASSTLARGAVPTPRKILALTYSNKAKDNLKSRLWKVVGAGWQQRIHVTNFHGLAARVIRAHGSLLGIRPDIALPEKSWRRQRLRDLGIGWKESDAFESALRTAKSGSPDDAEVIRRLRDIGHSDALAFEESLRADGRLDYDDLIRQCSRLLQIEKVARLYQAHFGMVMVDEVQDLSVAQYEMVRGVGGDTVTYAGDPAQGIYSFAGADPVEVFRRIRELSPVEVELNQSYRSAPAVLRAVNALAIEIGSTLLECGEPDRWPDGGHVILVERDNTDDEAQAVISLISELLVDPSTTVAVVARRGTRMDPLRRAADTARIPYQDWSVPTHVPRIVDLLQSHVRQAIGGDCTASEQCLRLETLCRTDVDDSDTDTLDEIAAACDVLRELVDHGRTLEQAVASCRPALDSSVPVAPGLHILTGHLGKGQEFDWVFVVGLENGQVPDFRSETQQQIDEELRVLHVMVSRARVGLVVTFSAQAMTKHGWRATEPSPWLGCLRDAATARR
ncbi:MAG: ATP-dependent helicase [Candidatus Dormibacteraeota bacterium]|nr:ATP-dependent helicase [Candidatus Dormibacteraeota bacterium]